MSRSRFTWGGGALAVCAAVVAGALGGCSGDNTAAVPASDGGPDGTGHPAVEASTPDSSASSSSSEAGSTNGATGDGGAGDGTTADADDGGSAAFQPLDFCTLTAVDFGFPPAIAAGIADGTAQDAASPSAAFGDLIVFDPSNPASFVFAVGSDCRTSGIQNLLTNDGGVDDGAIYLAQLTNFTVTLLGCPNPEGADAGALAFRDLLPAGVSDQVLTQADLTLLGQDFVDAVETEIYTNWEDNGEIGPLTLLTGTQVEQLQSAVAALAAATQDVSPSTTTYTFDTCSTDAGSD